MKFAKNPSYIGLTTDGELLILGVYRDQIISLDEWWNFKKAKHKPLIPMAYDMDVKGHGYREFLQSLVYDREKTVCRRNIFYSISFEEDDNSIPSKIAIDESQSAVPSFLLSSYKTESLPIGTTRRIITNVDSNGNLIGETEIFYDCEVTCELRSVLDINLLLGTTAVRRFLDGKPITIEECLQAVEKAREILKLSQKDGESPSDDRSTNDMALARKNH